MIQTDEQLAEHHRRPTTPRRVVAYVLDGILLAVIGIAYWAALGRAGVPGPWWAPGPSTLNVTETALLQLVQSAYAAAYFVGCWCLFGRTAGQRLLGLRVERAEDGRRLTIRQGIARWLVVDGALEIVGTFTQSSESLSMIVFVAGLLWWGALLLSTVSDPRRRGWHDKIVDSVVIAER